MKSKVSGIISQQQERMSVMFVPSNLTNSENAFLRAFDQAADTPAGQLLEPYFARIGKEVRVDTELFKMTWKELAYGDASINRIFAITLGYVVVGMVVALYLNVLNVGNVQSAGRAIRSAIRQQLIVVKVGTKHTHIRTSTKLDVCRSQFSLSLNWSFSHLGVELCSTCSLCSSCQTSLLKLGWPSFGMLPLQQHFLIG